MKTRYRSMDPTLRLAWGALIVGAVIAAGEMVRAQNAVDPIVRLGPEVWIVVAGGLVTVGINLEQIRRMRLDMREIKTDTNSRHAENSTKLDSLVSSHSKFDRRLDHVEVELRFLSRRRTRDDKEDTEGDK